MNKVCIGLMLIALAVMHQACPPQTASNACPEGTVASYLGTTCTQGPVTYTWTSYTCTSTPQAICDRLGTNGSNVNVRLDPKGPATLFIGATDLWNTNAGESVDVVVKGTVAGATSNLSWPHWKNNVRAQTGDGMEMNTTTVMCGINCTTAGSSQNGVSVTRCDSPTSAIEDCTEQTGQNAVAPYYRKDRATFAAATTQAPYPFTVEVTMNGGQSGSAALWNVGLHLANQ